MQLFDSTTARLDQLGRGAVLVARPAAIFEISGTGAAACLQGVVTRDVIKPGPDGFGYGAILTPKGMIVIDLHLARAGDRFFLVTEASARPAALDLFRRLLPPRLARVTDRSDEMTAVWLLGAEATAALERVVDGVPAPGKAASKSIDGAELVVASSEVPSPARHLIIGPEAAVGGIVSGLRSAGMLEGTEADLRAARVLTGTPTLGVEIDDKTLPQEAGLEALGGVSYDKGCYVGQETVARLHFRGHANWLLRGVSFEGTPAETVEREGKPQIRVGTVLTLETGRSIGLAKVRREIGPGESLPTPDGGTVAVLDLPLPIVPQ